MKKIRLTILILFLALLAWGLGGRISSSKEKVTTPSLFGAVSNTSATPVDSDKDGLTDEEEKKLGTNPTKADTDGDGFLDGQEVKEGYDPLKAAPYDKVTATTDRIGNNNTNGSNSNGNGNQSAPTTVLISGNQNQNQNDNTEVKENLTDKVAKKVDEIVASYKLYTTPYESIPADIQDKIKKDVGVFTETLLQGTGLDFAFSVDESKLSIDEKQDKDIKKYLEQIKNVFRKNGLITDNETLENGLKRIIGELQEMRKSDINWEKTAIWKRAVKSSVDEISLMSINPELKPIHSKILHIVRSFDIVFSNIQEGDYFRSFLSAGRADKINKEIDAFSEEIKKLI